MIARDLIGVIGRVTGSAIQSSGVRVSVKTNLGPEFTVWDGPAKAGAGLAQSIGIRGAVIVRDAQGNVLFTHGEPPETNLLLSAIFFSVAAYIGFLIWRGATK
jgi:hypothetical protein